MPVEINLGAALGKDIARTFVDVLSVACRYRLKRCTIRNFGDYM
jgi:hypothetical protein